MKQEIYLSKSLFDAFHRIRFWFWKPSVSEMHNHRGHFPCVSGGQLCPEGLKKFTGLSLKDNELIRIELTSSWFFGMRYKILKRQILLPGDRNTYDS